MVKYYMCMRFQSKASLVPRSLPKFQLLQIPILQQRVEWEWGARNEANTYNISCLQMDHHAVSLASFQAAPMQNGVENRKVWELG